MHSIPRWRVKVEPVEILMPLDEPRTSKDDCSSDPMFTLERNKAASHERRRCLPGKASTAEFRGGMHGGTRSADAQPSAVLRENLRAPLWLILGWFMFTGQFQMEEAPSHEPWPKSKAADRSALSRTPEPEIAASYGVRSRGPAPAGRSYRFPSCCRAAESLGRSALQHMLGSSSLSSSKWNRLLL